MFETKKVVTAPTFEELKDQHFSIVQAAAEAASRWQVICNDVEPGAELAALERLHRKELQAREALLEYRPVDTAEAYQKALYLAGFMIGTATALGEDAVAKALETLKFDH